jgi:hypothetical protein
VFGSFRQPAAVQACCAVSLCTCLWYHRVHVVHSLPRRTAAAGTVPCKGAARAQQFTLRWVQAGLQMYLRLGTATTRRRMGSCASAPSWRLSSQNDHAPRRNRSRSGAADANRCIQACRSTVTAQLTGALGHGGMHETMSQVDRGVRFTVHSNPSAQGKLALQILELSLMRLCAVGLRSA